MLAVRKHGAQITAAGTCWKQNHYTGTSRKHFYSSRNHVLHPRKNKTYEVFLRQKLNVINRETVNTFTSSLPVLDVLEVVEAPSIADRELELTVDTRVILNQIQPDFYSSIYRSSSYLANQNMFSIQICA